MPDLRAQDVLWKSNHQLAALERKLVRGIPPQRRPLVFICLCPRSGSTVLSQVLVRTGCFNYISNTLARFWHAPYIGGIIEKELGIKADYAAVSLKSDFGLTERPAAPHEFGYFWERWFPNTLATAASPVQLRRIDRRLLKAEVNALMSLSPLPLFFKSGLACMNIRYLSELFPRARFVLIKRRHPYIAQSIYKCRVKRFGRPDEWWSIKPRNYRRLMKMDCYGQIAGQIIETYREMEEDLQGLPARKVLRLDYEDFCRDPQAQVKKIFKLIDTPPRRGWQTYVSKRLTINNRRTLPAEEFQRLKDALEQYTDGAA